MNLGGTGGVPLAAPLEALEPVVPPLVNLS